MLATRQIIYLNNTAEIILFTLTVGVGYGLGSWILLEYTRRVTADLRSKSLLINTTHWTVTVIQFSLLAILLFVLFNDITNCPDFFTKCTNVRIETTLGYVAVLVATSIIMGIISFKFFSWYKLNKRNFMVLFFRLGNSNICDSDDRRRLYQANTYLCPRRKISTRSGTICIFYLLGF